MLTLSEIQHLLKETLPKGIDLVIKALKEYLPDGTDRYNDVIVLESRYRETNQGLILGVLATETANLQFNQLRQAILEFIDSLRDTDLKKTDEQSSQGSADHYNGEVFYRIPDRMQLEQEVKCIVRVAFDKVALMEDLVEKEEDVIKDIRISEVMGVELIDPNATPHFQIRSFNEIVQFVEKDLYTEWLFYVRPLMTGIFPLLLKISIIEIRDGKERKREVVLEETVEIVSLAVAPGVKDTFTATGIHFNTALGMQQGGLIPESESGETIPPTDPKPVIPPPPPPDFDKPHVPKGNTPLKRAAAALLILGFIFTAAWAIKTFILNNPAQADWRKATEENTTESYRKYLKKHPGGKYSEIAFLKLDSLETAYWDNALNSNDTTNIRKYMEEFPDGKYHYIARSILEKVNVPLDKQLYYEATIFNDSLTFLFRGGKPPYVFLFSQKGTTVKEYSRPEAGAMQILNNLKPGDYEVFLQDAEGSVFMDTISITPPAQTPVPQKKPVPAKKPVKTPPVTPVKDNKDPVPTPPEKPADKPEPVTPAKDPVIPMKNAYRLPAFVGCDREKADKEFKCTNNKIAKFLADRIQYPPEALNKRIQGKCVVEFVVEKDGSVKEAKVVQKLGYGCDEEALRLVRLLPPFKPGLSSAGKPIRVRYTLPVVFKING